MARGATMTWASTVWLKRGGRWQAFTHQETPVITGQ